MELDDRIDDFPLEQFAYLRGLCHLFLEKPNYARLVRHVTIRYAFSDGTQLGREEGDEEFDSDLEVVGKVFQDAIKAASRSEFEEAEWLKHASWIDHTDALLALMLPKLTQLKKLDLMLMDGDSYVKRMLERFCRGEKPFDVQPAFSNLTEIMHTYSLEHGGVSPTYTGLFGQLPSVRAIYGHRIGSTSDDIVLQIPRSHESCVTHIELKDCRIDAFDLKHLLCPHKGLRTLIYEIGGYLLSQSQINTRTLRSALSSVETSLQNLWIDFECSAAMDIVDETDELKPISFVEFETLKYLRIATPLISGYPTDDGEIVAERLLENVFPRSVQTLVLVHYDVLLGFFTLFVAIQELLRQKRLGLEVPELKLLIIEGDIINSFQEDVDLRREFDAVLKDAGRSGVAVKLVDNQRATVSMRLEERRWGIDRSIKWAPALGMLNEFAPCKIVNLQWDLSLSAKEQ